MKVELLYKAYLDQMGIVEANIGPVQRVEVKKAFYAGVSMILLYNTTEMHKLPTDHGAKVIVDMMKECTDFYNEKKLKEEHEKNRSDNR